MLLESIQHALSQPLPGEKAHKHMWPETRYEFLKISHSTPPVNSSVLALFYPIDNVLNLCFIKRTIDRSPHSGQIAFPGGKMEKEDPSLKAAAIRECREEIGVEIKSGEIAGGLSPLFIPVSNFMVHPFVGVLESRPHFSKNDIEVDEIIEIPFARLLDPETKSDFELNYANQLFNIPCYRFNSHIIWGATAMILSEIIELLKAE
ncbi:MAG: CoA pyrophosphatase [Bacteroidetes bacterium HGW-Bacteroidetes-21]|nr:MAG: CoA pyrophosphatase [Bacteroidetes bacterium HGW-Bacteroidetes-21]